MVRKKELEEKIEEMKNRLDNQLNDFVAEELLKNKEIASLKKKVEDYDRIFQIKNMVFILVNTNMYRTKEEKDEAQNHVRERMDAELLRLNIANDFTVVTLPGEVTNVIVTQH